MASGQNRMGDGNTDASDTDCNIAHDIEEKEGNVSFDLDYTVCKPVNVVIEKSEESLEYVSLYLVKPTIHSVCHLS